MLGSESVDLMDTIIKMLPILLPLAVVQLVLIVSALVHLLTHKNVTILNVPLWIVIILFINLFGPILYFVLGHYESDRNKEKDDGYDESFRN